MWCLTRRTLKDNEKKDYIEAVLCLQRLPSKADPTVIPGARTRWDDFNSIHITKSKGLNERNGGIHLVVSILPSLCILAIILTRSLTQGHFLPWHRYLIITYEKALREECGYKGAQPYWNWSLDTEPGMDIRDSPVFDPVTGFGGNGEAGVPPPPAAPGIFTLPGGTGGGCVQDGPFVKLTLNIGPGESLTYNPHCVSRSLNPTMGRYLNYSNIAPLAKATTFKEFDYITEATPTSLNQSVPITFHGAGHWAIGGGQDYLYSSNSDPLFYLHHTFIDSLWWAWQLADPSSRFLDISGPQIPFTSEPQVTLDFPIDLGWARPAIPISRVMDVTKGNKGGIGCYEYDYEW